MKFNEVPDCNGKHKKNWEYTITAENRLQQQKIVVGNFDLICKSSFFLRDHEKKIKNMIFWQFPQNFRQLLRPNFMPETFFSTRTSNHNEFAFIALI